jgi:DNA-binding transcriptional MerR regulator
LPESGSVIIAFGEEHVERLTGLTPAQLRYWDRTGFFAPSYAEEGRNSAYGRIYSFKDVVALRTLGLLRRQHNVPLQHLRRVAERLSQLEDDLWTKTTLYVLNRRVIFHEPGSPRLQDAVSGQYVLGIPLKKIVANTKRDAERLRHRPDDKIGRIEQSWNVSHNSAVVAGTRIPTRAIRNFKEAGYTVDQIIAEYPDLTPRDVEAALKHEEASAAA